MINTFDINYIEPIIQPFRHIEVNKFIKSDSCHTVYKELESKFYEQRPSDELSSWPVFTNGCEYASELTTQLKNSKFFIDVIKRIWNVDVQCVGWGYQATSPSINILSPHNDDCEETGYNFKCLIYIQDSVGTQLFDMDHNLFKTISGNIGNMFLFKCDETSYHGGDFTTITNETKRILLGGEFKII